MPKIQKEIQQYLCGGHRTCGRLAIILTFTLLFTLAKPSIQKCANVHKKYAKDSQLRGIKRSCMGDFYEDFDCSQLEIYKCPLRTRKMGIKIVECED